MQCQNHTQRVSGASALLFTAATLFCATSAGAQSTFTANGLAGENGGAHTDVYAVGLLYNNFGTVSDGITGVTFGNNFNIVSSTAGTYDSAFIIGGTITGATLSAGTTISIAYDFTLAKNAAVSGDVSWSVKFSDLVNNPGNSMTGASTLATGTLSAASAGFSGEGNYDFVTGVSSGTSFRLFVEVSYSGASSAAVTGTMNNMGYGGQGFTIGSASAVPEPSTYALIVGLGVLGCAAWRRQRAPARSPAP